MSSLLEKVVDAEGQTTSPANCSKPLLSSESTRWQRLLPAVLCCLPLLRLRVQVLLTPLPPHDFMIYWASGRLFLSGLNPYSATAMLTLERSVGWLQAQPMVMLYPPWAMPFVALIGLLTFHAAHYAWLATSIALEAISSIALWRYFGGEKRKQWIALVLLATFLPAATAEHMGQITPLILAGLATFLFSLRRHRYLLAGACLLTLGLKPHLLYLVFLAILLWAVQTKKWSLIFSAVCVYASVTIAAIAFNHNVLGYFHGTVHAAMDISCGVGGVLRSIFGVQHTWLQFLPTMVGTAWFARYWIRNRRGWTWEQHLPLVLLVSICTAPYFWADDLILAVPAFIALAVTISRTRTDWLVASALYLVVQMLIFTEAALVSKACMAAASLLWLGLYIAGRLSLARRETATAKSIRRGSDNTKELPA